MNKEKLLVELSKVPAHISVDEMAYEISRIMRYSYLEAKDIGGVYLDEPNQESEHVKYYILFIKKLSMQKLENLCLKLNGKLYLHILNMRIEVKFPGRVKWSVMTANVANNETSEREIMITNTPFLSIEDMANKLPDYMRRGRIPHRLISISQNRSSTFMKFKNADYAKRAKRIMERHEFTVLMTNTYSCLCREETDDFVEPEVSLHNSPTNSNSQRRQASNNPINHRRRNIHPSRAVHFNPRVQRISYAGQNPPQNSSRHNNSSANLRITRNINNNSRIITRNNREQDLGVVRSFNDMLQILSSNGINMRLTHDTDN